MRCHTQHPLLVVVTTVKKETWWLAEPINLLPGGMDFVLVITCPWVMLRKTKYSGAFGIWWNNVKTIRYFRQQVDTTPLRAKKMLRFLLVWSKRRDEMISSALGITSAHNSLGGRMTKQ
jgi:hypothetical protein